MHKKCFSLSSIVLFSTLTVSSFSQADVQNEVNLGVADIKDAEDRFLGIGYTRYASEINSTDGPLLITPYLQRIDSVSADYFGLSHRDSYNLRGTTFINDKWMLSGRLSYTDSEYRNENEKTVSAQAGYFINRNWQVGASLTYERYEYEFQMWSYENSEILLGERLKYSDTQFSPSIFTRYTQVVDGSGWDLTANLRMSDRDSLELSGRYFFNLRFSISTTYSYLETPYYEDEHVVEVGFNYWFSERASLTFGLGTDIKDSDGLRSATLLGSYRF